MGEDSEEMLDLVAQAWQVMETIRPKYSCRTCDKSSRRRHQPRPLHAASSVMPRLPIS
ncbi:IS66 family transposase zinc-finger binding domain-containing protein [Mesorhizobium sp. M1227]|uniref:IS66 family transposase zinc-finger binding domain-containing protein n=1 Tax=Mesorhizobium sp. M1227 TaxID=2957071 RepID=UPI00333CF655